MDQCNTLHLSQAHITSLYCIKMSLMREGGPGGGGVSQSLFDTLYINGNNMHKGLLSNIVTVCNFVSEILEMHFRDQAVRTICQQRSVSLSQR